MTFWWRLESERWTARDEKEPQIRLPDHLCYDYHDLLSNGTYICLIYYCRPIHHILELKQGKLLAPFMCAFRPLSYSIRHMLCSCFPAWINTYHFPISYLQTELLVGHSSLWCLKLPKLLQVHLINYQDSVLGHINSNCSHLAFKLQVMLVFWMIKLTKTPILPNYQVLNGFFCTTVNFIIQELKFR